jgi:hypothetical protein
MVGYEKSSSLWKQCKEMSLKLANRMGLTEDVDGEPDHHPGAEHIQDEAQGVCEALQGHVLCMRSRSCAARYTSKKSADAISDVIFRLKVIHNDPESQIIWAGAD